MSKIAKLSLLLGCVGGLVGCCPRYEPLNVTVSLDESMRDSAGNYPSVAVHFIGVNQTELSRWEDQSITEYWQTARTDPGVFEMHFGEGRDVTQTLKSSHPIWDRWEQRGAWHLVVLSSALGSTDRPGGSDPRRLILPLDGCRWDDQNVLLRIEKAPRGLVCLTPPKPPKQ